MMIAGASAARQAPGISHRREAEVPAGYWVYLATEFGLYLVGSTPNPFFAPASPVFGGAVHLQSGDPGVQSNVYRPN